MKAEICDYGNFITVEMPYAQAVESAKARLKEEGFGVLCEIDVAKTMKEKLGIDVEPHVILGACNPSLAHAALEAEANLGLLLPCNVVVRQSGSSTIIGAVDPRKMLGFVGNSALDPIGNEAAQRLDRVLERLAG